MLALGPVLLGTLGWGVFASACSPASDAPLRLTQRDSAGIAIVESTAPAWGDAARWVIDPHPLVDLATSGTGDPHNFYSVRGMRRMPDGSLIVANRGSAEIRKFSAAGELLGSAGGRGEGPGEFSNLQRIELVGDSVLVLDWDGSAAIFGPDLDLVRTLRLDRFADEVRDLGGNTLLVDVTVVDFEGLGLVRHPSLLTLVDLEGNVGDTIGGTPGNEEFSTEVLSAAPLFGKRSVLDTHDGMIYLGSADHMQIEQLDAGGDTVRILRLPDYPLALTASQVEAERRERLAMRPGGVESLPPHFVEAVESMPVPRSRPAYDGMLVDPTGAVWLRLFEAWTDPEGPESWIVLGPDGAWLGTVEAPDGFRVLDVGVDEVLGIWTSDLDEPHPRALRLRR